MVSKTNKIIALISAAAVIFVVSTLLIVPIYQLNKKVEEKSYSIQINFNEEAINKFQERYVEYKQFQQFNGNIVMPR